MKTFIKNLLENNMQPATDDQKPLATLGGLAIAKNKKVVIFYTNLFVKYAGRLNRYLNANGITAIDLTEQINAAIKSPIYKQYLIASSPANNQTTAFEKLFKLYDEYIKNLLAGHSKYEVVLYNVSAFKIVYAFKDYIPYYISSNYNMINYFENLELNLYGELMDIENVYEFEQNTASELTLSQISIENKSMHGNIDVLNYVNFLPLLADKDMFITFIAKYGLRTITGFKLTPSAKPIVVSSDEWDTIALNNIKNTLG